jgi:general secretion pathway protein G
MDGMRRKPIGIRNIAMRHAASGAPRMGPNGFTLIELLVVIVIIGLLATIVAINVLPATETARVEKAKADIATIGQALEQYRLDNMQYPSAMQGLRALVMAPVDLLQPARYRRGGYIRKLPDDPWGHPYVYQQAGDMGGYVVQSLGADGEPGGSGDAADISSQD